MPAEITEAQDS